MLRISPPLGQYYATPGTYPGYTQPAVDPLVHIGLQTAGQALAPSDPGAPETFRLIERIIVAPGFPSFVSPSGVSQPQKISDLNPVLRGIAIYRENSVLITALVLAVPVVSFLLGRKAGMRAR